MENWSVETIEPEEFEHIYTLIERDFCPEEHAPYRVLRRQIAGGIQSALSFRGSEGEGAYAVCADAHANGYVLISLFAVGSERRGRGVGSAFLARLARRYAGKKALIVEVERVRDARDERDRALREARIRFYRRAGFRMIGGISYSIWDVPMHLMILPLAAGFEEADGAIVRVMDEIYRTLLGPVFYGKLRIARL